MSTTANKGAEWADSSTAYARLTNPRWRDYRPELPAGDPALDAQILDMLEQFSVEGEVTIKRTFLANNGMSWQISYKLNDSKGMMMGGGLSVRDALASLATSIAERAMR